jgi:hypothetical protein
MTKRIISLILAIMCLTTAVYADETLILNGIPVDKSYGQSADETTTVETTEGETATDVTSGTTADTTVEDTTILPTDEMLSYLNMLGEMISTIDEQYSFIYNKATNVTTQNMKVKQTRYYYMKKMAIMEQEQLDLLYIIDSEYPEINMQELKTSSLGRDLGMSVPFFAEGLKKHITALNKHTNTIFEGAAEKTYIKEKVRPAVNSSRNQFLEFKQQFEGYMEQFTEGE